MDSRGEASVGQLNNHPPFVNPPSIPLLYCSSAGWYTGWDAPWLFLFLSSFFFLFFLYFSLYRQIRATEYEYIIRVTSGTRTMQLGKGGEERFVSFYPEELFEFSPRPIKIFTPISWRTLRSDGFREHDRHFRILDQILRSISCHVRGNWSNWLIYCRYGIA